MENQRSGENNTFSGADALPLPTSPKDLMNYLKSMDISFSLHHHAPIFTVAEGEHLKKDIPGIHCRNLFLKDKKDALFLVVCANETVIDLKILPDRLRCGRLSFGSPQRLWESLGVRPGSVCPFALINDKERRVTPVLDASMMAAERVVYHPLVNDLSLGLAPSGLLRFLDGTGHRPEIMRFG